MKKKKKRVLKFLCFFTAFVITVVSIYFSSDRIVVNLAEKTFDSIISSASYHAVDIIVEEKYRYSDLVDIKTDSSGNVGMIITDSYAVNKLAATAVTKAYAYLSEKIEKGVEVPLGAFTGIRLISGFGAKVRMKVISVASVKCDFVSEFAQAGINQTRHSLYLNINCVVNVVTKTKTKKINDKITVLVFDNLIVGKVPNVVVTPITIGKSEIKP